MIFPFSLPLIGATTTTAASGGNRESLLGPRPARRKQSAADAGCLNPGSGTASAVTERFYQRMSLTDTACYFKNLWTARATMPPRMPETRNSATPCTPTSRTTNIRGLAAPLTDTRFWT